MSRVGFITGFNLVPCLLKSPKYSLSYSQSTDLLASFSIISDASSSAVYPNTKIVKLFYHAAQVSVHHTCTEDGYLQRPHPPIIDGDNRVDRWIVVGWASGWQTSDTQCT